MQQFSNLLSVGSLPVNFFIFSSTSFKFSLAFSISFCRADTPRTSAIFTTQLLSEVVHKMLKTCKILLYFHNHQSILIQNKMSKYQQQKRKKETSVRDIYSGSLLVWICLRLITRPY